MGAPLLFNPSRASTEELRATFVGRWPLLQRLEKDLLQDAAGPTARHWNLIGPRGSGKSHITELLGRWLAREHGWAVVRLPEEHYQISNVADLLEQILVRLPGHEGPSPFAEESDPARVEELVLDRLRQWGRESQKPLLVILENLGAFLHGKVRSPRDQKRLREILMRDAPFLMLTTATSYIDDLTRHEAPFYDFFQVESLQDLSQKEVADLIEARARWDQDKELLAHQQTLRHRAEAIYHFSGGNPRLVLELYKVLRRGVTAELHTQLLELLDEVTPYYQARLGDLRAPQAERVLTELALAEGPITPSEVARRMRISTNQVTALVSKLQAERFVRAAGRPDARRRYYDLTDRLFRIWMQMREDRGARRRLRFLTTFFQRWYEGAPAELHAATGRVRDAFWVGLQQQQPALCGDMLTTLDYLQAALPGKVPALNLLSLPVVDIHPDDLEQVAELLTRLIQNDEDPARLVPLNFLLGLLRLRQERHAEALAVLLRAVALDERRDFLLEAVVLRAMEAAEGGAAALVAGHALIAEDPAKRAPLRMYLVLIAARTGQREEARRLFADCQKTFPPELLAYLYQAFALTLLETGAIEEAQEVLERGRAPNASPAQSILEQLVSFRANRGSAAALRASFKNVDLSTMDHALLFQLGLALSKEPADDLGEFPLWAELWRRSTSAEDRTATLLIILAMLLPAYARGEARPEHIETWLREKVRPGHLKQVFPQIGPLGRSAGVGGRWVLLLYRGLRARGLLDEDIQPFAAAAQVVDSPDREQALFGLHPEIREAVELLLSEDAAAATTP